MTEQTRAIRVAVDGFVAESHRDNLFYHEFMAALSKLLEGTSYEQRTTSMFTIEIRMRPK